MEGIVAKIWNIKEGTMGRGAAVQITDSISYITNSEKCDGVIVNDDFMQVGREVSYVINDIKTLQGLYVGGRHISDIQNATNEMMQVKKSGITWHCFPACGGIGERKCWEINDACR